MLKPLTIREMEIKIKMRYYLTLAQIAIILKKKKKKVHLSSNPWPCEQIELHWSQESSIQQVITIYIYTTVYMLYAVL